MKKRKDGRYAKQVTIGIKTNGKPIKKTVYGKTIKEVEKNYRELMLRIDMGVDKAETMTAAELLDEWYRIKKEGRIRRNTELLYKLYMENIKCKFGNYKIKKFSVYPIEEFLNNLSSEGHIAKARVCLNLFNMAFNYAVQKDYLYKNPCIGLSLPRYKRKEKRILTEEEKQNILNAELPLKEKALLYLLRYTGARKGEILALKKNDFDMQELTVQFSKTLIDNNGKPFIQNDTKTEAGYRIMPILLPLIPVIKAYLDTLEEDELLFLNNRGNLYANHSTYFLLDKIKKQVGLNDDVTFHTFRHTLISECYFANVDVKKLQEWIGHADIGVTMQTYTHISKKIVKDGSELNAFYSGSQTEVKRNFHIV